MPYGMWKENPGNVIVEWSGGFYCAWMTGERKCGLYKVIYYPENEYEYVHKHRVNPKEFMNVVDEAEEYNHVQFMEEFGAMDHTLSLERLMTAGHKTEQEKHRPPSVADKVWTVSSAEDCAEGPQREGRQGET